MDEALIKRTNELLERYMELVEREKEAQAKGESVFEENLRVQQEKSTERMKERIKELGLSEDLAEGSDEDWQERHQAILDETNKRMQESHARSDQQMQDILAELRLQTSLLQQIQEKLA